MSEEHPHTEFFIKKEEEESEPYMHRDEMTSPPEIGLLRTRRISLEAH